MGMQDLVGPPGPVGPPQPYAVDPRSAHMAGVFGMPNQMQGGPMSRPQMPGRMQQGSSMPPMMQGGGRMPGSAGLFDQYMQGGMMPRYRPPAIAGVYGDTGRGYTGFLAPQMPKYTPPQIPAWIAGLLGVPPNAGAGGTNSNGAGGTGPGDTGDSSPGSGVGSSSGGIGNSAGSEGGGAAGDR
jgi:hypothetical protein